jgi:hypothetical protein
MKQNEVTFPAGGDYRNRGQGTEEQRAARGTEDAMRITSVPLAVFRSSVPIDVVFPDAV